MNASGVLVPPGAVGEIVLRGANVMKGYAATAKINAAAFTDGWFRTCDQGRVDEDGYLFITGRIKEIINRGGEKKFATRNRRSAITLKSPRSGIGTDMANLLGSPP